MESQEPQCGYCALGLSCRNCSMGPCRIDPFDETGPKKGICGADADIVVARNLARTIAAGASAHSDHGRDILEALYHTGSGSTSQWHSLKKCSHSLKELPYIALKNQYLPNTG